MKKRNSSKSVTKRNRRKSDYVVEHPNSSELGMLDRIKPSPRIHRSDEQFMAKVNRVSSPVELHSETVSYIPQELEDSMYWNSEHQLISELPPVLTNTLAQPTDSTLEMTAIAHADELLEMNPCNNNDDSESDCRDEQEQCPVEAAVTADKLADDSVGSEHVRAGSIFKKHLGFTPVRVMSERSPALQFGTTLFTFEHQDQRELEINVLFTSSYEKADYTFVCTSNLYGTCAVIREQYDDGVVVRVVRELNSLDDSTAPVPVSGALSWIAVG